MANNDDLNDSEHSQLLQMRKFDDFAGDYDEIQRNSLGIFNKKRDILEVFAECKIKEVKRVIGISPRTILDFGCGIGRSLPYIARYFSDAVVYGCDSSQESLNVARRNNPGVRYFLSNESGKYGLLDFENVFDMVIMICVMHHITPDFRVDLVKKISRTLTTGGFLVTFEHNPINPVTRHMVRQCVFDQDSELLRLDEYKHLLLNSGMQVVQQGYTLLFPWRNSVTESIERLFSRIPLGSQYYLIGKRGR